MAHTARPDRSPGTTYAISDTGPLISALQSDSVPLLASLFSEVHLPAACALELADHGWQDEVESAVNKLLVLKLTTKELKAASAVAGEVAKESGGKVARITSHAGEAQAIVLAQRPGYRDDILLIDEAAARLVARKRGLRVSGFPGVLLLAVQVGLISATSLRIRLERCRAQGTHYSREFIGQVCDLARGR
jgi:predicted nucleic acid-binding protein